MPRPTEGNIMTNRLIGPLLCGSLLLLAVLTPAAAPAAPVNFACSPTKVKGSASALDGSLRTSTVFSNIPEAAVAFTQEAAGGCVIVRFSAWTFVPGNDGVRVRAFLDNATAALPFEVQYSGADGDAGRTHSFEFVFPHVAAGNHVVRMQFRSALGTSVYVNRHTTVVQFK
jgi:hypothetical protein